MPRSQPRPGRDILKLNLWRRNVELDVGLRFGGALGNSHSLTEDVNDDLKTDRCAEEEIDDESESFHSSSQGVALPRVPFFPRVAAFFLSS